MSDTMKVRFLRPWRDYSTGQVIEPFAGQAKEMIARGIVVAIETAPAPAAETVQMVPPLSVGVTFPDDGPKSGKKRKG